MRLGPSAFLCFDLATWQFVASCVYRIAMNPQNLDEPSLDRHRPATGKRERPPATPPAGRRAHQTWRRFGAGNGVIGVRSRMLSIPRAAIGSQRSIRRVSDLPSSFPVIVGDPSARTAAPSARGGGACGALPYRANRPPPRAPWPRSPRPPPACCRGFAWARACGITVPA